VKRDSSAVKVTVRARRGQRRSRQVAVMPGRKWKEEGKVEGKAVLVMPCREEAVKPVCWPMSSTTAHPPSASLM
jgi:hypothetical protein